MFENFNKRMQLAQDFLHWIRDFWTESDNYYYFAQITLESDTDDSVDCFLDSLSGFDYQTFRKIGLNGIVFNDERLAALLILYFPNTLLTHK